MNNKIILTKKPRAIFLAIILLVAGVIVMSSPFSAYGEKAYQIFKCNGNNVNIDNIEQIKQRQTENNNFDAAANSQQQQMTPEKEPLNALTGSNSNGNDNGEPLLTLKNICLNFGINEKRPSCQVTVDTITGLRPAPWGIAFDPVNERMYVANTAGDTVSVIDTTTNEVIDTITVENGPAFLAYEPINRDIYVTSVDENTVSVIDTSTNDVIGNPIPVGSFPAGITYDSVNHRMYVTNMADNTVSVINLC